jgi:hypothetical protein
MVQAAAQRLSGPSGWTQINGHRYRLGNWEIFDGDPEKTMNWRGWFRCDASSFQARKSAELHLSLKSWHDGNQEVDVTISVNFKAEHLWEFISTGGLRPFAQN